MAATEYFVYHYIHITTATCVCYIHTYYKRVRSRAVCWSQRLRGLFSSLTRPLFVHFCFYYCLLISILILRLVAAAILLFLIAARIIISFSKLLWGSHVFSPDLSFCCNLASQIAKTQRNCNKLHPKNRKGKKVFQNLSSSGKCNWIQRVLPTSTWSWPAWRYSVIVYCHKDYAVGNIELQRGK